jgi:hypothetical protein
MICRILPSLMLAGFFTSLFQGQTSASSALAGVVSDQTGAVVPDAQIESGIMRKASRVPQRPIAKDRIIFLSWYPASST